MPKMIYFENVIVSGDSQKSLFEILGGSSSRSSSLFGTNFIKFISAQHRDPKRSPPPPPRPPPLQKRKRKAEIRCSSLFGSSICSSSSSSPFFFVPWNRPLQITVRSESVVMRCRSEFVCVQCHSPAPPPTRPPRLSWWANLFFFGCVSYFFALPHHQPHRHWVGRRFPFLFHDFSVCFFFWFFVVVFFGGVSPFLVLLRRSSCSFLFAFLINCSFSCCFVCVCVCVCVCVLHRSPPSTCQHFQTEQLRPNCGLFVCYDVVVVVVVVAAVWLAPSGVARA